MSRLKRISGQDTLPDVLRENPSDPFGDGRPAHWFSNQRIRAVGLAHEDMFLADQQIGDRLLERWVKPSPGPAIRRSTLQCRP